MRPGNQEDFFWAFDVSVGTPSQNVSVVFDTGSPDLVVNSANSRLCQTGRCSRYRAYDETKSSRYTWISDTLKASFEVGGGTGSWLRDSIRLADRDVSGFQMGVTNKSSTQVVSRHPVPARRTTTHR